MDVVSVALNLLPAGFVAGLGVAGGAAKKFGKEVAADFDAPKKNLSALGTAGLVMGGVVAAGFGLAVKSTLDFDSSLSELGATIGANSDQMGALRDKALQLGKDTSFSATEAAQAMVELGKVGLSTEQIMGGAADATVALAAAGGVDLPQAATIAAAAMTQFKMAASDLPHVADLLAGAANASAADVTGLGTALGYVGPVAAAAGLSIDDTAAALALLSNGGLEASSTGTALRSILTSLEPTTEKARQGFEKLGLVTETGASKFYDAQGKVRPLNEILDLLRGTFGDLTEQETIYYSNLLFGERALSAVNIMASTTNDEFAELQGTLADTSATEVAAQKLDNLSGDLEALGGSIETALIEGGSKATGVLRGLAQGASTVVDGFSGMPPVLQNTLMGLTGLVGIGAGIGGLAIKAAELQEKLSGMGNTAQFVGRNLATIGTVAGIATIAIAGLAYAHGVAQQEQAANDATTLSLTDKLIAQSGAVDQVTDAWLRQQFSTGQRDNIGKTLKDTSADLDILTQGIIDNGTELDEWRDHIFNTGEGWGYLQGKLEESGSAMADELLRLVDAGEITGKQAVQLARDFDFLNDRVDEASGEAEINAQMTKGIGDAAGLTSGAVADLGGEMGDTAAATADATAAWEKYEDTLKAALDPLFGYQSAVLSGRDAQDKHTSAVLEAIEATRLHGEGSLEAAEAQRDLERAELDLAQSALDTDIAMRQLSEGLENGSVSTDQYRSTLQRWVSQGLITQGQADALAWSTGIYVGKLHEIPLSRHTTLSLDVQAALAASDTYLRKLAEIDAATGGGNVANYFASTPNAPRRALGGPLSPRSIYEMHDTPEPEWVEVAGRTFLLTGSAGGLAQSGHPGAHTPIPQWPTSGGGGPNARMSPTGPAVTNVARGAVEVHLHLDSYLGDESTVVRELADPLADEIATRLDALAGT